MDASTAPAPNCQISLFSSLFDPKLSDSVSGLVQQKDPEEIVIDYQLLIKT